MTPDELAKHGLRVKPLYRQLDAQGDLVVEIAAALEPIAPRKILGVSSSVEVCFECDIADCHHIRARRIAPPDVAQAARVLLDARWAQSLTAVHAWMKTTDTTTYGFSASVEAALRAIAGETP